MNTKSSRMKLEDGKVYLYDTRNGNIHQYEDLLSQMAYMKRFIAGKEDPRPASMQTNTPIRSGAERRAEYERLAAMTPEQREADFSDTNAAKAVNLRTDEQTTGQTAEGDAKRAEQQQKPADKANAAKSVPAPPAKK